MALIYSVLSEVEGKEIPLYPIHLSHGKFRLFKLKNGFFLQEHTLIHGFIDRQVVLDGIVTDCSSGEGFKKILDCALRDNEVDKEQLESCKDCPHCFIYWCTHRSFKEWQFLTQPRCDLPDLIPDWCPLTPKNNKEKAKPCTTTM